MSAVDTISYFAIGAVVTVLTMAGIARQNIIATVAPATPWGREWQRRMNYQGRHWRIVEA